MRIGVDAMGGDYAPRAVVEGVGLALEWLAPDEHLVLFGDRGMLEEEFSRAGLSISDVEVVDCPEVITMHDHPVRTIAQKSRSSITIGFQHLAEGRVDGFASAGNTGAMMAGTMTFIKAVPGILRPGIAAYIPVGERDYNLMLDVGLNSDCKPEVLLQYGLLGALYSQFVLGVERPRVGLLNIGNEAEKGNLLTKQAYALMAETDSFTFAGNIEGNEVFSNARADVVVCDGFVGNVVLKEAEAFYVMTRQRKMQDPFFERFNFEHYGGTPVLGVNAPVIIGHGISNGRAISNMVKQTSEVIRSGLCDKFKRAFSNG